MTFISRMCLRFSLRFQPSLAHFIAPRAPAHLQPTEQQIDLLEQHSISSIAIVLLGEGGAIQRSAWRQGRKDDFLPYELLPWPRDVLFVQRIANRTYLVSAGEHYARLPVAEFTAVLDALIVSTIGSIRFCSRCAGAVAGDF